MASPTKRLSRASMEAFTTGSTWTPGSHWGGRWRDTHSRRTRANALNTDPRERVSLEPWLGVRISADYQEGVPGNWSGVKRCRERDREAEPRSLGATDTEWSDGRRLSVVFLLPLNHRARDR